MKKLFKKSIKYVIRFPIYLLIAVMFLLSSFSAYDLYNRHSCYAIKVESLTVHPFIIVGERDINDETFWRGEQETIKGVIEKSMLEAEEKWEAMTGIDLKWGEVKIIEREEWAIMYSTPFGGGEVEEVVESLYPGEPIIVFVESIISSDDDPSCFGVADWGRMGAVLEYFAGPKFIVHEIGHVLGLGHYRFPDNVMYDDGDVSTEYFEKSQIGKMKRKIKDRQWN